MPCLIVTGHPCSGKSTISQLVKERALLLKRPKSGDRLIEHVIIINEESACPDYTKNECYSTPTAEKKTRAALKSAFDRAVTTSSAPPNSTSPASKQSTLVILDSLNYIKGFRYELHCVSKAAGERHGILWVLNRQDILREWNSSRGQLSSTSGTGATTSSSNGGSPSSGNAYDENVLKELIQRYEPPDERNRWDKPLYTVDISSCAYNPEGTASAESNIDEHRSSGGSSHNVKSDALRQSVYNMHALGDTLLQGHSSQSPASSSNSIPSASTTKTAAEAGNAGTRPTKRSAFQRIKKPNKAMESSNQGDMAGLQNSGSRADSRSTLANSVPQPKALASASATILSNCHEKDAMHGGAEQQQRELPHTPKRKTLEEQIDDILNSFLLDVAPLKEGLSTQRHIAGNANVLQDIDATTQKLVSSIVQAQNSHTGGYGGTTLTVVLKVVQASQVPASSSSKSSTGTTANNEAREITFSISNYQRPRSLPELRRLRKQYLQWVVSHPPEDSSIDGIATSFLNFIQNQKETSTP